MEICIQILVGLSVPRHFSIFVSPASILYIEFAQPAHSVFSATLMADQQFIGEMASSSKQPVSSAQSSQWTKDDKDRLKAKLMENLSLQDLPPGGGPNHVQPAPGGPPQLPPQVRCFVSNNES